MRKKLSVLYVIVSNDVVMLLFSLANYSAKKTINDSMLLESQIKPNPNYTQKCTHRTEISPKYNAFFKAQKKTKANIKCCLEKNQ